MTVAEALRETGRRLEAVGGTGRLDATLLLEYVMDAPRENFIGRPLFVYWSIQMPDSGVEEKPLSEKAQNNFHEFIHFFDETRWKRTFHPVK